MKITFSVESDTEAKTITITDTLDGTTLTHEPITFNDELDHEEFHLKLFYMILDEYEKERGDI